jgi:tRNA(Ile)-lysidine synthase
LALAQEWQLEWIDDPSNVDMRFDRNFLRAEVLPLLTRRWPGAAASAVRCARAAGDAEAILDSVARADARYFDALDRLPIVMLRRMDAPRRRNFLRYVVAALGLPQPSARQLAALERLCDSARALASAQWTGAQAHRFKGFIYLLSALSSAPEQAAVGVLTDVQPLELPCGTVTATPTEGPGLPAAWLRSGLTVRYRSGGERFQPPGAPREILLKEWLRSIGVVPWMRSRIPIFVHDGQIVAVGDLGVSANAQIAGDGAARMRIVWEHRPRVY